MDVQVTGILVLIIVLPFIMAATYRGLLSSIFITDSAIRYILYQYNLHIFNNRKPSLYTNKADNKANRFTLCKRINIWYSVSTVLFLSFSVFITYIGSIYVAELKVLPIFSNYAELYDISSSVDISRAHVVKGIILLVVLIQMSFIINSNAVSQSNNISIAIVKKASSKYIIMARDTAIIWYVLCVLISHSIIVWAYIYKAILALAIAMSIRNDKMMYATNETMENRDNGSNVCSACIISWERARVAAKYSILVSTIVLYSIITKVNIQLVCVLAITILVSTIINMYDARSYAEALPEREKLYTLHGLAYVAFIICIVLILLMQDNTYINAGNILNALISLLAALYANRLVKKSMHQAVQC